MQNLRFQARKKLIIAFLVLVLSLFVGERYLKILYLEGELELSKTRITQITQPISQILHEGRISTRDIRKQIGPPSKLGEGYFRGNKNKYLAYMKKNENYGLVFFYNNNRKIEGVIEFPDLFGKILTERGEFKKIDGKFVFLSDQEIFYGDDNLGSSNKKMVISFKREMSRVTPCINYITCPIEE